MYMSKKCIALVLIIAASSSVFAQKKKTKKKQETTVTETVVIEAAKPASPTEPQRYAGMYTKKVDLIHTAAELKFDWDSAFVFGKATLTLKPYFYAAKTVELDAKGFKINEVGLVQNKTLTPLVYAYDGKKLVITLDKEYSRNQEFKVQIDYVGMPDKLKVGGSAAITADKGLYFINKGGKNPNKPRQIWTQGETESNSCWLPTIDGPQEKHTQELYITVPDEYVTLSNGLLKYSTVNADGTRTDAWKQDLPHSTYLTMMAIGKYAVVKDKWRDMEVSYYVEPEYEQYARLIFGKTPKMLECFSTTLGVDYPWDKYAQVIARDYVSGAMENTSATIHGEFMQVDDRDYLDVGDGNEDVISHELFHHWFGDLVTCESWANLPLNESFATYGEYIWEEYEYGRDAADYIGQSDQNAYLQGGKNSMKTLFRPDYMDKEDMFDLFSYQKGGRVLYMLRRYVGDDAFYTSLRMYLEKNKFGTAEIADLRMAFEEVTGEDLNWFFNQWFTQPGQPDLNISYAWNESNKTTTVSITQKQDLSVYPLYKLPIDVDLYVNGVKNRERIWVTQANQEFSFASTRKPDLVNVDAEKMLLCTKNDEKTKEDFIFQYTIAPLYLDRYEALEGLEKYKEEDDAQKIIVKALSDPFWNIRSVSLSKIKNLNAANKEIAYTAIVAISQTDAKAAVRARAVNVLATEYAAKDHSSLFKKTLADKSNNVAGNSLKAIAKSNVAEAMNVAQSIENTKSNTLKTAIAEIYATNGTAAQNTFFVTALGKSSGFNGIGLINQYKNYLLRMDATLAKSGIDVLKNMYADGNSYVKYTIKNALSSIAKSYELDDADSVKKQAEEATATME